MFQVRKVLCPTDFSPCSGAAVDHAVALAKTFKAEVVLLHVVPNFDFYLATPDMVTLPVLLDSSRKHASEELAKASRRIEGVAVRTELLQGTVHECILAAAASAKADLIVLGTHGHTGVKHMLLGSVAERVVRLSPVPVLTVRPHGK